MPNPKFPDSEKFLFFNSISLTLNPLNNMSFAASPLIVQKTEIFSFLLIPKDLTVYLALPNTGFYPVKSSKTLAAFVNLSPDSPAQM